MRKFKLRSFVALLAVLALTAAACGGDDDEPSGDTGSTSTTATGACATADASAGDLLAQICDEGVIRVSTDPAYPPQSSLTRRRTSTRASTSTLPPRSPSGSASTIEWETPYWEVITAGSWNDRWDMSVGSMTVTAERAKVLDFTPAVLLHAGRRSRCTDEHRRSRRSTSSTARRSACARGCTYESYLQRPRHPGLHVRLPDRRRHRSTGYDTDSTAIQDLALGRSGSTRRCRRCPRCRARSTRASRSSSWATRCSTSRSRSRSTRSADDSTTLRWWQRSSEIIEAMHADGTLTELSKKWYDGPT